MSARPIAHGTHRGYTACRKRPEGSCLRCRRANAAHAAEWRAANPAARDLCIARDAARDRALRRLAKQFPAEFQALHKEELAALSQRLPERGVA